MKNQSRHNRLEKLKSVVIVALIVILTGFIYKASTQSIEDVDLKLQELEKKYEKQSRLLDEERLENKVNKKNLEYTVKRFKELGEKAKSLEVDNRKSKSM